jgi:hypothetical protein
MTCRDRSLGFRVFDLVAPNLSETGWDMRYISGREFKIYTRKMNPDLQARGKNQQISVEHSECTMQGLGLKVEHLGCTIQGLGLRVEHLGCTIQGLGLRVEH